MVLYGCWLVIIIMALFVVVMIMRISVLSHSTIIIKKETISVRFRNPLFSSFAFSILLLISVRNCELMYEYAVQ